MDDVRKGREPLVIRNLFFACKPNCLKDAIRAEQKYERTDVAVVEKVVTLSHEDFVNFMEDLNSDRAFITDNIKDMGMDSHKRWHCLLVIGAGEKDGILVQSEGFAYPRYAARLKGAGFIDKSSIPHTPGKLSGIMPRKRINRKER